MLQDCTPLSCFCLMCLDVLQSLPKLPSVYSWVSRLSSSDVTWESSFVPQICSCVERKWTKHHPSCCAELQFDIVHSWWLQFLMNICFISQIHLAKSICPACFKNVMKCSWLSSSGRGKIKHRIITMALMDVTVIKYSVWYILPLCFKRNYLFKYVCHRKISMNNEYNDMSY